jgi:hypothetical protein
MSPVTSSRHYTGPGLGEATMWNCPACAAENSGPLEEGCRSCGAGRAQASRAGAALPPPPAPDETPRPSLPPASLASGDAAREWLAAHPDATLYDAFVGGYLAGVQDVRRQLLGPRGRPAPAAAESESFAPEHKVGRTLIAALTLFRDQVLVGAEDAVSSGEWCSVAEVNNLLQQLTAQHAQHEGAHA